MTAQIGNTPAGTLISLLRPALVLPGRSGALPACTGLDAAGWREIYNLAVKHNVQGVLKEALAAVPSDNLAGLPLDVAARLVSDSMKIMAIHNCHRRIAAKMAGLWKEKCIEARMLKGLETAKYYPNPETRVLGDIDWWIVRPEDWAPALDAVHSLGMETNLDSDGDVNFEFNGTVVELHHKGLSAPGEQGELRLLAWHVLHHATVFGCELRHICDYAVARYRLGTGVTEREKGLEKWYEVLDNLSDYIIRGTAPSPDAQRLLEMTVDGSGAFGRAFFFLRIAPGEYLKRIAGLCVGRMKRFS